MPDVKKGRQTARVPRVKKAASIVEPADTMAGAVRDQGVTGSLCGSNALSGAGPSDANAEELVSNTQPITEEEAEALLAPEDAVQEEERLRQERERAPVAEEPPPPAALALAEASELPTDLFNKLDHLINKATMYTQFLTEQMSSAQAAQMAAPPQPKGKAGAKRKAAGKPAAGASKRSKRGAAKAEAEAAAEADEGGDDSGKTPTQALVPLLVGELREYQLKGIRWMVSLWQNGLNGILADQMGLGKTVQTIGFLSHLCSHGVSGPFLVVGPLSTLPNWVSEFQRWCPSMPVVLYHGSKQARAELRAERMPVGKCEQGFPVVVTSYEIVLADSKALAAYNWKYLVVDEGHRLKNTNCRLIRELKTLPAEGKLLLTGTPLQNNLGELWSLLNFLLPEVFSSLADFVSWFDLKAASGAEGASKEAIAAEQRALVVSKLHACLKPFLLRRLKVDVEVSLPRKQEVLLYANMTQRQREINKQLAEGKLQEEMSKLAASAGGPCSAKAALNNVLMQMRKNCNHPDLITAPFSGELEYPPAEEIVAQSGKMRLLQRMLTRLKAGGHKVLIFSQMTKMMDLLESYLEQTGEAPCRLDGSIAWEERQASIKAFNEDPARWLFLLSTRAGGLGINLTSADTVIIYDSDWNPHQDLQAMDRCHRIGQVRPVLVLRMATAHSVESKMLRRAQDKMALERLVIKKGLFKEVVDDQAKKSTSLSAADLADLMKADVCIDDVPTSGEVDDATLDRLLDRAHLADDNAPLPYPSSGVGYEVVAAQDSSTLLRGVE